MVRFTVKDLQRGPPSTEHLIITIIIIINIIINALVNNASDMIDNTPQQVVFGCIIIQTGKPIELT